jgi:AcrR family transcriptional regulator
MSPKLADPAVRTALIETAAELIASDGTGGLTLRRLAREVGTSTMAVYTHFGGMDELRRAVRQEGFARLAAHQAAVGTTDDPVADLVGQGWAYYTNATTNPNLYRAMFMDVPSDEVWTAGPETFEALVDAVQRCIDGGRFDPADASHLASQLWATAHGVVSLQIAHLLSPEQALACLTAAARNLVVAFGDDPSAYERSLERFAARADAIAVAGPS